MKRFLLTVTLIALGWTSVWGFWSHQTVNVGGPCATGNDSNTALLVHSNTTDGSVTFTDSGNGATTHVLAKNGTVEHDVDKAKYGKTGILFGGIDDWLETADHADWYFAGGNFTVEFWYYRTGAWGAVMTFVSQAQDGINRWYIEENANKLHFTMDDAGAGPDMTSTDNLPTDAWTHVAVVREGNNFIGYISGVSVVSTTSAAAMPDLGGATGLQFGTYGDGSNDFAGWLDEIAIHKGTAKYTANFTPNTYAYCD